MVNYPPNSAPDYSDKGFISAFYPPIWLGENHVFSQREKIAGYFMPGSTLKVGLRYKGREMTVMKNGVLVMMEPSKQTCMNLINEIMCTALLLGIPSTAIRDRDINEAQPHDAADLVEHPIDLGGLRSRSLLMELRTVTEEEFREFKVITEANLKSIVSRSEDATSTQEESDCARRYIEAHTCQVEGSFGQAVEESWLIVEHHIESEFAKLGPVVTTKESQWGADDMLVELRKRGRITEEEFKKFDSLRARRNEAIHSGAAISSEGSREFLKFAERLTRKLARIPKPVY